MEGRDAAAKLHGELTHGWNERSAEAMTKSVAEDGLVVGFDGSVLRGRDAVADAMAQVFADHEVARYVCKVEAITELGPDLALLQASVGMVAPGGDEVMPDRNAVQTVLARRRGEAWEVALFQNTPARFDGRPDDAEALTRELNELA
jgi:uncharacterized protein (TIGR02246 family)